MSWGAIGGATVSVVGGSLLGGGGSSGGQSSSQNSGFDSFAGQSGLFNTSYDVDQDNLQSYVANGQLQDAQALGLGTANQFGGLAQNNQNSQLAQQAGAGFLGQLNEFDPMQVQQSQFNLLNPQMQEQFQQDRLAQENRQFAQGRLGSTGGAQDVQALRQAQGNQQNQLMFDSFGQGQQAQAQMAQLGGQLSQLDPQLSGMFQNVGNSGLQNALGIDAASLNQSQVAGSFSGQYGGGSQSGPSFNPLQTVGQGLVTSGAQGLGNAAAGLFTPGAPNTGIQNPGFAGNPAGNGYAR